MPAAPAVSPLSSEHEDLRPAERGTALCLSGGGYRAMLFHVGTLWRLYEAGRLQGLKRISSVSGGSITAATLALAWPKLSFEPARARGDFPQLVVEPLRRLAGTTIDRGSVIGGVLGRGSAGDRIAAAYKRYLFGDATLQSLPDDPRFVINATNVQSGVLWRFSKPFMGDYRVGRIGNPTLPLAVAVAASSAFPPVLSPIEISLEGLSFLPLEHEDLHRAPYTTKALLSDGGVYDNMGLETAWKRFDEILVSDAGARIAPEKAPKRDWARHAYRVLDVIDSQVRALRKRALIAGYRSDPAAPVHRKGAYWGIGTAYDRYDGRASTLSCPAPATARLAAVKTRLAALDTLTQEQLINWGYAITDAAVRTYVDPLLPLPQDFPYPQAGIG